MAKDPIDSKIMEYKDTISQLNMTVKSQNEIIVSLRQTIDANHEIITVLNEKVDYLTKKLFGTSSEKSKNVEGSSAFLMKRSRKQGLTGNQRRKKPLSGSMNVRQRARMRSFSRGYLQRMKSSCFLKARSIAETAAQKWRSSAGSLSAGNSGSPLQRARSSTSTVRRQSARCVPKPLPWKKRFPLSRPMCRKP